MAKSVNVSGRMSVGRFEEEFEKTFGVRCNVKLSKWRNADNKATLASIRPKDFNAPKKVNLPIVGNMTVRTLKERFEANFGVMIELYVGRKIAPDNVTIGAIREGRVDLSKNKKVKKVEEEVMSTKTSDNSNELVSLSDEQIKEFKDQENEAEDMWDYQNLAYEIADAGDKKWSKKVYQKAEEKLTEDVTDIASLACAVANEYGLGDFEYALDLFKKAHSSAETFSDYKTIITYLSNESFLDNHDFGRELLKEAENLATTSGQYRDIADLYADDNSLSDKEYARKMYEKAEELAEGGSDFTYLAQSVVEEWNLNDKEYARKILEKAESLSECENEPRLLRDIGRIYSYDIKDNAKAMNAFKRCETVIDSYSPSGLEPAYWDESKIEQYIYLANSVADEDALNDQEYAKELFIKAESLIASGGWDSSQLVGSLEDFGDVEWSKNIEKGNYGTKGTTNIKNDKSSSDSTLIKIEINNEKEHMAYNVIDVILEKNIDASDFNADRYHEIINDKSFLKKAKEAIQSANGWKYGYYMDGEDTSLKEVMEYVSWGESIQIRLIAVGDKDLSFLSLDNFSDDGKEEFLKGTSFEAKEGDDDFEDSYDKCVGSYNLLAFDYVANYED